MTVDEQNQDEQQENGEGEDQSAVAQKSSSSAVLFWSSDSRGSWLGLRNDSHRTVSLAGWQLRARGSGRLFVFPATKLQPGATFFVSESMELAPSGVKHPDQLGIWPTATNQDENGEDRGEGEEEEGQEGEATSVNPLWVEGEDAAELLTPTGQVAVSVDVKGTIEGEEDSNVASSSSASATATATTTTGDVDEQGNNGNNCTIM